MKLFLVIFVLAIAGTANASDNDKCKIYGGKYCKDLEGESAAGGAAGSSPAYKGDVDARGWAIAPADLPRDKSSFDNVGKNVEPSLDLPVQDYVQDPAQKKMLRHSDLNVGKVKVDTETGNLDVETPGARDPRGCNYSHLIGKRLSEIAMPPKSRVLHEGDAVTMEYMEGRVNIIVNKQNVVINVTCG